MADEIDKTQHDTETITDSLIKHCREQSTVLEAKATGKCLYCGEELEDPSHRWCSVECRDAWEEQRKRRSNRR